jgi:hypothetical protein
MENMLLQTRINLSSNCYSHKEAKYCIKKQILKCKAAINEQLLGHRILPPQKSKFFCALQRLLFRQT